MKSFIVSVLLFVALAAFVECSGYGGFSGSMGGYGGGSKYIGGYGKTKGYEGPNILYGGYTMSSHSVSGPSKWLFYNVNIIWLIVLIVLVHYSIIFNLKQTKQLLLKYSWFYIF